MNANCPRLIEVALPIREISAESVRDKSLRHGHISTLHLWWARRPLAVARAVVFASFVPDPDHPDCPPEFRQAALRSLKEQVPPVLQAYRRGCRLHQSPDPYRPYNGMEDTLRNRLLMFIAHWSPEWLAFEHGESTRQPGPAEMLDDRSLVKWETSDPKNEQGRAVLDIARELMRLANDGKPPVMLDPFSGGGAIPLEAARLGCQAIANDYNPVAYLILRATCEFPQKFGKAGKRMVEREEYGKTIQEEVEVPNVLAYDVELLAKQILERARQRIGHLYPVGEDGLPVVSYLWARTVQCSNPSCRAEIPLLKSFLICDKPGKRIAIAPLIKDKVISFQIVKNQNIQRTDGTMIEKGRGDVTCLICNQTIPVADIRRAGIENRLSERPVAVITESSQGKEYRALVQSDLSAINESILLANKLERPNELILSEITGSDENISNSTGIRSHLYGMKTWGSLFNPRQLVAIQTFIDEMQNVLEELKQQDFDSTYREALSIYLALWLGRISQRGNSFCTWNSGAEKVQPLYGRQAIPMVWDYPEIPAFSNAFGSPMGMLEVMIDFIKHEILTYDSLPTRVHLGDAAQLPFSDRLVDFIVTDPPYFDAIAYADLSDFFYVWLKRSIGNNFPGVFITPLTPKAQEATALKHRHQGDSVKAREHFTSKLSDSFREAKRISKQNGIISVMFAHQSTEAWTALINALLGVGLNIVGTYPIDTEAIGALKTGKAVLSSSVTVICRQREIGSNPASYKQVKAEVEKVVSESIHRFWKYGFRGADLIVSCYGPAVGVFGKYEHVERADGNIVTIPDLLEMVRQSALKAIAGEFNGDSLSRLYFVWANLYGISEQSWDDARLVIQIGGDSEDAMQTARHHELFVVNGPTCRLALLRDRLSQKHLGEESDSPLIDQLHYSMALWKQERRSELVQYLKANNLTEDEPFWKLAQALFEVLPRGEEDWKLISALLGERETLKQEVRQAEPPKGPEQLSLI